MIIKHMYKGYTLVKCFDDDVIGGYYYNIFKDDKYITNALTLSSAKELIDNNFDERFLV